MEERKIVNLIWDPSTIPNLIIAGEEICKYILGHENVVGEHRLAFIVKASPMVANEIRLGKMMTQ